jgi:TPP-dependent indolepyruvate ferredoxin oxidoreductase alpha subunit
MPFSNPDFPGRVFNTTEELQAAIKESKRIESELAAQDDEVRSVTATIIPAPQNALERRVLQLESQLEEMSKLLEEKQESKVTLNKDNLPIGMVLKGESKGQTHKLEILEEGYLCSNGEIVATLSAAAEEVSGNRRSGWAFWTDSRGTPIGEITGRFKKRELSDPFGATGM